MIGFDPNRDNILSAIINALLLLIFLGILYVAVTKVKVTDLDDKLYNLLLITLLGAIFFVSSMLISSKVYSFLNFYNVKHSYIVFDKKAKDYIPDEICDKDTIEIISYIDNEIVYKCNSGNYNAILSGKTTDCLEFRDKNSSTIDTKGKKVEFKNNTLTFLKEGFNKNSQNEQYNGVKASFKTYIEESGNAIKIYNINAISTLGKYWLLETKCGNKFEIESELIKAKKK